MVSLLEFRSSTGRKFPVEVRRRRGIRYMRLRYTVRNRIVVSMPWHGSDRKCLQFIDQNRQWLERQINAAPAMTSIREWLSQSPRLAVRGQSFAVSIQASSSRHSSYHVHKEKAQVALRLSADANDDALARLVRKFAKEGLSRYAAERAESLGLSLAKVGVRDQSSRWGSCSSRKTISLNWRLVLIPPCLQDYVIYHELAHLTEMNHSRRFWDLLEHYDPDRRRHEVELDTLTPAVMRVKGSGEVA